jgi:threonine dehydrogenase-like Zn-dependent dehydrogenase
MRAAIVGRPGRLVVRDVPEPDIGPFEARCEMLFGAVCTGTDRHVIDGSFPFSVDYPSVLATRVVLTFERDESGATGHDSLVRRTPAVVANSY